jgi:hypothetical protein
MSKSLVGSADLRVPRHRTHMKMLLLPTDILGQGEGCIQSVYFGSLCGSPPCFTLIYIEGEDIAESMDKPRLGTCPSLHLGLFP